MALVSRWDIRTETYSDGATVTSLTDRAGSTNLSTALGVSTKPTYDAALNAVKFVASSSQCLGSGSLAAGLSATPAGSAWSIFYLIYQNTLSGDILGGFGNSSQTNSGLLARTFAAANAEFFLRDNVDSTPQLVAATAQLTASTWQVLHITYDGTNVRVGIDGANLSSATALSETLSGVTWNQFVLGAYSRSTTGSYWTGFLRECRVYDSNEHTNLSTIVSAMKAGASGLTITSVNTTNTAFSAQTNSAVIGTGLSASVVCTYAGIACTNESASSSTSLKITFPNFFTNNIKLGRNYEFKVVG